MLIGLLSDSLTVMDDSLSSVLNQTDDVARKAFYMRAHIRDFQAALTSESYLTLFNLQQDLSQPPPISLTTSQPSKNAKSQ